LVAFEGTQKTSENRSKEMAERQKKKAPCNAEGVREIANQSFAHLSAKNEFHLFKGIRAGDEIRKEFEKKNDCCKTFRKEARLS
jgi:hypothetical protein